MKHKSSNFYRMFLLFLVYWSNSLSAKAAGTLQELTFNLSTNFFYKYLIILALIVAFFVGINWLVVAFAQKNVMREVIAGNILFVFILGLFFMATKDQWAHRPVKLIFNQKEIKVYTLSGSYQSYPASEIRTIRTEKRHRYARRTHKSQSRKVKRENNWLIISFPLGKEEIAIRQQHTWDFGYKPEEMAAIINDFYKGGKHKPGFDFKKKFRERKTNTNQDK